MSNLIAIKQLLGVWHTNVQFFNYPGLDKLACFWLEYCSERPEFKEFARQHKELSLKILRGLARQPDRNKFDGLYAGWMAG